VEVICVDTDILIEYNRKKVKSDSILYKLSGEFEIAITSVTAYEILRGDDLSEDAFWKSYFTSIKVLPFDLGVATLAGTIYRALKSNPIDMPDLLIAAIAMHHGLPLATLNKKHFERVPLLKLVQF
jgi:tRNA(fMet)-specific endonuclease VapC